jgi:hypothetical protein
MAPAVKRQLRFYQVQAQVSGVTADEWTSSRQVPTVIVGADDPHEAVRAVSDMAWNMSSGVYNDRTTYATVVELINGDNGDRVPLSNGIWVRVRYSAYGIETVSADTYGELRKMN